MVQDNYRKIKLPKLLEMLRLDTDEQYPMTTSQICARLDAMGIICDRRTLSKDIALLNKQGYEVMDTTVGHEKGDYVEDIAVLVFRSLKSCWTLYKLPALLQKRRLRSWSIRLQTWAAAIVRRSSKAIS